MMVTWNFLPCEIMLYRCAHDDIDANWRKQRDKNI